MRMPKTEKCKNVVRLGEYGKTRDRTVRKH